MTRLTITEALAELKTLAKRIEKKRTFIRAHALQPAIVIDPLAKEEGGSAGALKRELQAVVDLERRIVAIRTAIQRVNHRINIAIGGETKSIAEWLTWRKEVGPGRVAFVDVLQRTLRDSRAQWERKRMQDENDPGLKAGVVIHVDEGALAKEAEQLQEVLGTLDGQLSLKNATEFIELND